MIRFKTNTDWIRNAKSEAIVYSDAEGEITEVTLADFVKNDTAATLAERELRFHEFKNLSDRLFEDEEESDKECARNELPLFEEAEAFATESLEAQIFGDEAAKSVHQDYLARREKMLALIPLVLEKLTEVQRRRFLLHEVDELTVREIADREGVKHQSVVECLAAVDKKIKKFLADSEFDS